MTSIPLLKDLYNSVLTDLETQYGIGIPIIGKNFLRGVAAVQSAKLWLIYLMLANVQKNVAPDTADSESVGGTLERFGRIIINRNPFSAQAGQYRVQVSGTIGSTIGTVTAPQTFLSDDTSSNPGQLFILDNPYTLISDPDYIIIRALTAGTVSALSNLDTLTATSPIANVDSTIIVQGDATIAPLDAETTEQYRTVVVNAERLEPEGGSAVDYRLWSQDAQGVANVYPYRTSGKPNQIDLYVESIIVDSTDGKGTPPNSMLLAVQAVVEFNPNTSLPLLKRGRRPLQVIPNYLPVNIIQVDVQVTGFIGIDAPIEAIILSALKNYMSTVRPFVAAADIVANQNDTIEIFDLATQIKAAKPGAQFTGITLLINSVPEASYQFLFGNIPYLNSVTYA